MELSKPPKDVLGLGQHLVRELDFENGADTLGRWMAHHLAALMDEAENGATAAVRSKARKDATETIIKIWEHRTSLPGKAYPLAPYKDALLVLERLRPTENPFSYFGRHGDSKRDQLSADLFDNLTRLVIALLLMKISAKDRDTNVDTAAFTALSETEVYLLTTIQQWGELFEPITKNSKRSGKSKEGINVVKVDLDEAAIKLIERMSINFIDLLAELNHEN